VDGARAEEKGQTEGKKGTNRKRTGEDSTGLSIVCLYCSLPEIGGGGFLGFIKRKGERTGAY